MQTSWGSHDFSCLVFTVLYGLYLQTTKFDYVSLMKLLKIHFVLEVDMKFKYKEFALKCYLKFIFK